jgi:hypothetical protein
LFGFKEARQAKEVRDACNRVKGMSLGEVVEEYSVSTSIVEPTIQYDHEVANSIKMHMDELNRNETLNINETSDEEYDDKIVEAAWQYCNDNDLGEDAFHIYQALNTSHLLVKCVASLRWAFRHNDVDVEYYFFNDFLNEFIPEFYLVPILFPAKKGKYIETFNLTDSNRNKLIDSLFSRFRDLDQFRRIVSEYALNHPYFRDYPLFKS